MIDKIKGSYRTVKIFFRNIRLWYPVLKEDRQWDYAYLYKVIRHKLSLMEDFQRSDKAVALYAKETGDEIRRAIVVLDRLIEDDYMSKEAKEYYTKLDIEDIGKGGNEEEVVKWFKEEDFKEKEDREFLFNYMRDNIKGWWD